MFCPTEKAPQIINVALDVCGTFEVLSGGAWAPGGFFPSWADHRWTIRVLSTPLVVGPIWLVVVPKAANQLLTASALASNMAVATYSFEGGGAVWQLSDECLGPAGPDLDHWAGLLIDLGVWHGPGE